MIQLYGLKNSNYCSLVKAILIEKGLDFEEIPAPPTQKPDNLARSPMGKMPAIGVDGQYLSESMAIALYLEQIAPQPQLVPSDAFAAAKVLELSQHLTLDVELVARRVLPAAFFGATASEEVKATTKADLERGMAAIDRIFVGAPYATGETLTLADFYTFYTFGLASMVVQKIFDFDLLEGHDNIRALTEKLASHPSIARTEAEKAD